MCLASYDVAMKAILTIAILALGCAGCSSTRPSSSHANLLDPLRPYVSQIANDLDRIPEDRKIFLDEIATTIVTRLGSGGDAKLTFICTHNSRRSHMSQIWAS